MMRNLFLESKAEHDAWPRRIGFYTGAFDPPHPGHVELVGRMIHDLKFDMTYVSPNPITTNKSDATPYLHRKNMSLLAFAMGAVRVADPNLEELLREGGQDKALQALLNYFPDDTLIFRIMGDDRIQYYLDHPECYTNPRLKFVFSARDGKFKEGIPAKIRESEVIQNVIPEKGYNSTLIRESFRQDTRRELDMIPAVEQYIVENNLYS
ncbi:MAG: hypothetical protein Q7S55_01705 [Nanoarchaeota archaeon]|nr:hypothetical protein [Nanoarchaeota archaeon]